MVLLPWSLKLVVAPLIERFAYLPMGRRRHWLLAGQCGLMLNFAGLALVPDPLHHLALLTAAVVVVQTFTVFQDVATDSIVIDIVPLEQQGRANSLMWGAKVVGIAASLATGNWLLHRYGFGVAMLAPAGFIGLIRPILCLASLHLSGYVFESPHENVYVQHPSTPEGLSVYNRFLGLCFNPNGAIVSLYWSAHHAGRNPA